MIKYSIYLHIFKSYQKGDVQGLEFPTPVETGNEWKMLFKSKAYTK